jgi:energy-converting hydrogenase Eha subunit E
VVGEERTMTCQILVVVPFAIYVVMQTINTKIIPKCSIVVMKSLNLPEASSGVVLSKKSSTRLTASLLPSV